MQEFESKQSSGRAKAAQVLALSLGLAGASAPASAESQISPAKETAISLALTSADPLVGASMPPVPKPTAAIAQLAPPTLQISRESLAPQSEPLSPMNKLFSTIGGLLSASCMVWYYTQIRNSKTAISVTSVGLQATNDILLCTAALVNHQGWGAVLTAGFFGLGGLACLRAAWQQGGGKVEFKLRDKLCASGCLLGWGAIVASWTPEVAATFGKANLQTAGSWIATGTYIMASIPIMAEMLSKPKPQEIKTVSDRPWLAITKTIGPYLMGTAALMLAVAAVPSHSWATLTQPVGLMVNNFFLTAFITTWAMRRTLAASNVSA